MTKPSKIHSLAMVFCLAIAAWSQTALSADWLYTVRPGDTFWDLCLKYTNKSNCWQELPDLNQVKRTRELPPGYVIRIPVSWLKQAPAPVTIEHLSGDVFLAAQATAPHTPAINSAANTPKAKPLSSGEKLSIGSTVYTENGYASLRFADGSTLMVMPYSSVALDAFTTHDGEAIVDSRMRLLKGTVKAKVKKRQPQTRFSITTPDAVAAVRGTEFQVSSSDDQAAPTRIEVFEGLVGVGNDKSQQEVPAGFGISASKDKALATPKALLTAPVITPPPAAVIQPYTLEWQALEQASNYEVHINSHDETNALQQHATVATTAIEINNLAIGCYTVNVSGVDAEQFQGLAAQQKLCTAPNVGTPVLDKTGLQKAKGNNNLTWAATEGAQSYEVQFASDAEFSHITKETTTNAPTIALTTNKTVFIRVRAIGEAGQASSYSNALPYQPKNKDWQAILFIGIAFIAGL